jgi:hypothetical protein
LNRRPFRAPAGFKIRDTIKGWQPSHGESDIPNVCFRPKADISAPKRAPLGSTPAFEPARPRDAVIGRGHAVRHTCWRMRRSRTRPPRIGDV